MKRNPPPEARRENAEADLLFSGDDDRNTTSIVRKICFSMRGLAEREFPICLV